MSKDTDIKDTPPPQRGGADVVFRAAVLCAVQESRSNVISPVKMVPDRHNVILSQLCLLCRGIVLTITILITICDRAHVTSPRTSNLPLHWTQNLVTSHIFVAGKVNWVPVALCRMQSHILCKSSGHFDFMSGETWSTNQKIGIFQP